MLEYRFSARDSQGRERTGSIDAGSELEASQKIEASGLQLLKLKQKPSGSKRPAPPEVRGKAGEKPARAARHKMMPGRVIRFEELAVFTRQLATLLRSGLPLLRALEVLIRQERRNRFRSVLEAVADEVRSGGLFSEGLAQYPKIFNRLYINMVKAGEASGKLAEVLDGLARFMEKSVKTASKVKSAMVYPVVVLSLAFLIVSGLLIFVIPIFEGIFEEILDGAPLPLPTRVIVGTSNFLQSHWVLVLAIIVALGFAGAALKRTDRGGRAWDKAALLVPFFSGLVKKSAVARFARTFGTLLESGVPILDALWISGQIVGNRYFEDAVDRMHNAVRDGQSLSEPLGREKIYPVMMTSMVEVGEETGALPEMLLRVADTYDDDVDNAVAGLTSIIEPFMIIFLAVTIGFIVIALFLPILQIMQSGFG